MVTHFCAPAFVFFAGTSAFLSGRKHSRPDLSRHLVVRGAWLVLLELTVIRSAWTFNVDYAHYILAGVIWMLGVCLMLLAGLVWLPVLAIGLLGVLTIAGHNLVDLLHPAQGSRLLQIVYFGGVFPIGQGGPSWQCCPRSFRDRRDGRRLCVRHGHHSRPPTISGGSA